MDFTSKSALILNALTAQPYRLQSVDSLLVTAEQLDRITTICNEEQIYSWLFRDMFSGRPYPRSAAADWINWGCEGWKNRTHFVFAVMDSSDHVVAACDIKDPNLDAAEIGYWCSIHHRGIMTNAILAMMTLAEQAGFRGFSAQVHSDNIPSQQVLLRAGFVPGEINPSKLTHRIYRRASHEIL